MILSEIMRIWIVLTVVLGLSSNGLGRRRLLRVRNAGNFGRRILQVPAVSTFYQPPRLEAPGSDPLIRASESRRTGQLLSIQKPSQQLQLPMFNYLEDSIAAETGESPKEYPYDGAAPVVVSPPPDFRRRHKPTNRHEQLDETMDMVYSDHMRQYHGSLQSLASETDQRIDVADTNNQPSAPLLCSENDEDCGSIDFDGEIPGEPGIDYPVLSEIVETEFDCESVPFSGYYADSDPQAQCQMFHICLKGNEYRKTQKWTFLCPVGSIFNQEQFVCDWWYSAPACSDAMVRDLSFKNAELGWDNMTDVQSVMENLFNANLQPSSSNSRSENAFPSRSNNPQRTKASRNTIPYRVPIKVDTGAGARTQLKEVRGRRRHQSLNVQQEYTGQESETHETSLQHHTSVQQQSQARRRTKTSSSFLTSDSEAYEQKDAAQGALPGPQYLPPETQQPVSSAAATEPTVTTTAHSTSEEDNSGYSYPSTHPAPAPESIHSTTTEQAGYNYQPPSTTAEQESFNYQQSTERETNQFDSAADVRETTTEEAAGYRYPEPTNGLGEPPVDSGDLSPESHDPGNGGGYAYDVITPSPTTPQPTQENQREEASREYLPPKEDDDGNLHNLGYSSQDEQPLSVVLSPTTEAASVESFQATESPESGHTELAADIVDTVTEGIDSEDIVGGYGDGTSESPEYPTPGGISTEEASDQSLGTVTQHYLPKLRERFYSKSKGKAKDVDHADSTDDSRIQKILQEIKNGGAEVRDENGNTLDFDSLKQLIMSTPDGLFSLHKAEEGEIPEDSQGNLETSTTPLPEEPVVVDTSEASIVDGGGYETVQPIVESQFNSNQQRGFAPPELSYLPPKSSEHFTNNQVVRIKHPGFEISAPSKEFESHAVQQNIIDADQQGHVVNFSSDNNPRAHVQGQTQFQNANFQGFQPSLAPQPRPVPQLQTVKPSVPQPQQYYSNGNSGVRNTFFQSQGSTSFQNSPASVQYLPPPLQSSSSQTNKLRTSFPPQINLASHANSPQQASFNSPVSSRQRHQNPNQPISTPELDIKIVPAVLVDQHTRVEDPNKIQSHQQRNFKHQSRGIGYGAQSVNIPVTITPPRLSSFTYDDALPKRLRFTANEARSSSKIFAAPKISARSVQNGSSRKSQLAVRSIPEALIRRHQTIQNRT